MLVVVNPNPTITVTPSRTLICKGETNTLTTEAASFVWQGTLGVTSTVVVKPNSTTIYTLTGTNAQGCTNQSQVTVIVNSCNSIEENKTNRYLKFILIQTMVSSLLVRSQQSH